MATLAILIWPVFAIILFHLCSARNGLALVVIIPYLFLPEAFSINLPGLPDLSKNIIISLGLFLCLLFFRPKIQKAFEPRQAKAAYPLLGKLLWGLFVLLMGGTVLTVLNNAEALRFGPLFIPPARLWDSIALCGLAFLVLTPFWLAARYMADVEMHRVLLKWLAIAVLGYSLLMLVEIRLSPQLHNWVYGYHQHSFLQHIRDGYRPKVFLQHGIWVGFLVLMGVMAAAALWRTTGKKTWLFAGLWIYAILVLSENLAALAIATMLLGVFFTFGLRLQRWLILGIALSVLFFPALRQGQLVPTQVILSAAQMVSEERAGSLAFRLRHEDKILERALQKPLTGWGGWGRGQVYDADGRDISVSEGRWIQTLSRFGWIGYIALFGLLISPLLVLSLGRRLGTIPKETMALALIAGGNLIYMIPNSTMTPVGLLVFGAVAGFAIYGPQQRKEVTDEPPEDRRKTRYTRFARPAAGSAEPGMPSAMRRAIPQPPARAAIQRR